MHAFDFQDFIGKDQFEEVYIQSSGSLTTFDVSGFVLFLRESSIFPLKEQSRIKKSWCKYL